MNCIIVFIAVSPFTSLRLTELWFRFWQNVSDNLYPCSRKNNLVLKSASHSHSSIALLAAIGLLVPLILAEKCIGCIDAYPEITDTFVACTEDPLLSSLDSIDIAGAVYGLWQTNIRRHTTQTGGLTPSRWALHQAGYNWRNALERLQNIQSIGI